MVLPATVSPTRMPEAVPSSGSLKPSAKTEMRSAAPPPLLSSSSETRSESLVKKPGLNMPWSVHFFIIARRSAVVRLRRSSR